MGEMHPVIDPITRQFMHFCKEVPNREVLEIGAAYGYASQKALQIGAEIWVNDLDMQHLILFEQNFSAKYRSHLHIVSGDFTADDFITDEKMDAILAVRVIHFPPLKR